MSFLGLEGLHVFVTGAAGGIGSEVVREFLNQGCKVTAHDLRPIDTTASPHVFVVRGNISDETSIEACIASAKEHHGPINILVANAGITDESHEYPIWETPLDLWQKTYDWNIRGTFLTIKHFLRSAKESQSQLGAELDNLAIVVTGSETGKFGQAGHTEYASGKAGLQYGLVRGVKNEIVRLNSKARINAVAPGWVDTPLIGGRLDDPKELWAEAQATVPLKKIAQPQDVARAMAFLASHRAAGHISGECISVDGGMEGRVVWKQSEVIKGDAETAIPPPSQGSTLVAPQSIPSSMPKPSRGKVQVALSVDFDAISGWLGTGAHPDNNMADYSQGIFSGKVGAPRLVRLFKKLGVAEKMTWFVPGHSMETFPDAFREVVDSGCEIGLHGYSHEGADQLTQQQERDVFAHCIDLATKATGKKPVGWRAPLYQIRESTYDLLEEHGFLYDTSLTSHDAQPFFMQRNPPIKPIDFSKPASTWMHPATQSGPSTSLVGIPCNWYMEDATPLQFYPHTPNSHGYVDVRTIEQMWKDRFLWLRENAADEGGADFVFPLVLHPDTSGMAHVIGMIERFVRWLQGWGDEVEFWRYEDIARAWRAKHAGGKH
ncbi:polysaccharide deacetylase family protein [Lasallia pustulata]|uniref:Polysaccharide deacetylase family protein n=1 Tax=Lasallia pustulata TaxID=136370 RepID=A0A1W5CVW0_9LECA|nr:polysaccharide deacetylase family protein [Lasallia pustulata]